MNWKSLIGNIIGSYLASFGAAWGAGFPPKQAAIIAGIATITNAAGLLQKAPQDVSKIPLPGK